MSLKGTPGTARSLNRRMILNCLRQTGPMSRVEIVSATGLSPAAVTLVTAELMADDLLEEGTSTITSAGRRPIPLTIKYGARLAIGIKIMERHMVGVLTDLSTRVLVQSTVELDSLTPASVVDAVMQLIERLAPAKTDRDRIAGIGVGLPGLIDAETGVCVAAHRLDWRNVPIASMLAQRVDMPVWIDNDVNAYAIAQYLFGHGQQASTLAVVTVGRGIGAGIVINGRLHGGAHGAAGEIGHMLAQDDGRLCECGRRGCLEAYASEPSMLGIWGELDPAAAGRSIESLLGNARAGDATCRSVIHNAGRQLGLRVADLINLVDPDVLVIGGEGVRFGTLMFDPMREALTQRVFSQLPTIVLAEWGEDAWVRGAAALAIQRFFDFESIVGRTADMAA
ncbi:MAG: ROK family transcriptional regulator [Pseudomonadota bacterium]